MSMSSVEREDRQLSLAHAVQLAATGRTDPTATVSYAEDFLGFLRADAPAPTAPPAPPGTTTLLSCPVCQHAPHGHHCSALRTDDQPCACMTVTRTSRA